MDAAGKPLVILFSQLSGAALLYEALGNRKASAVVSKAQGGLTAAVEKHQGQVVKTVGDELMARFARPDDALQAVAAMQLSMKEHKEGLALKAGFAFGPVIEDKDDVFGDTVNVASRLAVMANPRQVLTTKQTVDGLSPMPRSTCRALYTTGVKGRSEEVSVYEVIWQQDKSTTVVGDTSDEGPATVTTLKLAWRGRTWNLGDALTGIIAGRDPAADIVLPGDKVSRQHAKVFLRRGKYVLADQSANGTYVQMQHRAEILLHREEFVLLGAGSIGLGQSVADIGEDAISFEIN
jgi:class 3 adenylate cyclase